MGEAQIRDELKKYIKEADARLLKILLLLLKNISKRILN
jgi:hypothetical protein